MTVTYYPRDAMLAWYYHTYGHVSVRPSVTSRRSMETSGRIELFLHGGFFRPITRFYKEIRVSTRIGYFPLELCHQFWTEKICHGRAIVETCYQPSST